MRIISFLAKSVRSTLFLVSLVLALSIGVMKLGFNVLNLTNEVATLTAAAASTAILHKKQLSKAVAKERAKARLKRLVVAIPVAGTAAAVAFEASDVTNWLKENPDKSTSDYGCEVAEESAEVIDEVLIELPELIRPPKNLILSQLPKCS